MMRHRSLLYIHDTLAISGVNYLKYKYCFIILCLASSPAEHCLAFTSHFLDTTESINQYVLLLIHRLKEWLEKEEQQMEKIFIM